ncbi:MAG: NAD(P)H-dependent oxidoreductase [Defluviitaleaceae bacterium]|nr:NAD(P)H-dependent oxidoreductase [Defluviitaleaceae bacterium]
MKICIINFSGRGNGNCHDIARFIEEQHIGEHEVTLLEMCDLDISPCGKYAQPIIEHRFLLQGQDLPVCRG